MSNQSDARLLRLAAGVTELGLTLERATLERLLAFVDLLQKWNRVYNLSAIRDREDVLTHHLLDSLSILPHLPASASVADVGSGAGLPGLVLAIARPELRLSSIETVGKKVSFQQQVKIELGLANVQIIKQRVEKLQTTDLSNGAVDVLVSRAFASVADFIGLAGHLVAANGLIYAMKAQAASVELAQLPAAWVLQEERRLQVPGLDAERRLLLIGRSQQVGQD